MLNHEEKDTEDTISPDYAFATLGNETRLQILYVLGDAEDTLSFSDLRKRVGVDDPGQFNYHLNKLKNHHFIRPTDDGYVLREPGRIVLQAVLSGSVTRSPVLEATVLKIPCP
ncbi:MAG: winged helix-turn-helix domain-containing protein, partial [Halobacteriales archaeon]|nr:winged helix-turn-helix domain-containing protein [Halobacteriales archaeon]